ncbi:MAG: ThiF family adenylyltransferase [Deltaproteobacteria bacterium]|nr:ThiF family adenylyltransferase [Deltaproteobacteria bacterium]
MELLRHKRALIIGMGGLGSPAALVLARAGVGALTLVDDDDVDITNLQRQILFRDADVGRPKAEVAREQLLREAPECAIDARVVRVEAENAAALFAGHDVILDGSDNFETKFLCSDVAMRLAIPLVHAGALRFQGQLLPVLRGGACVRCLFEQEPPADEIPSCAQAGVLGAVVGVLGAMQAAVTLELLRGERVASTLRTVDLKSGRARELELAPRADCPTCAPLAIDITAERCPMTYVRTKLRLETLAKGTVLDVVLRGDEPLRNVPRSLKEDGHQVREIVALDSERHRVRVEKR